MKSQKIKVTLNVEIDEDIYECMQDFFIANPHWNSETIFNASLSLFLIRNYQNLESEQYQACGQKHVKSTCGKSFQDKIL